MFTGLALHCLRGHLLEHLGLDIDKADCAVEQLSASHVCLRLQDVAITQALWRLLVGIDYPFFVDYGRISEVRVEINSDTFNAEVRGIFLKLRLLRPEEWEAAVEAYRKQVAKQKDRLLNDARSSETVRWMKAKMKVTVTSLAMVLQDDAVPVACAPHSLAMLCSCITLADPDDPVLLTKRAGEADSAVGSAQMLEVPFHSRGRDTFALMAKDITMDDLHIFMSDAPPVGGDLSVAEAWSPEDAICPRLTICVAYRAWEFTALKEHPEASHEPRKKIVLHMRAGGTDAQAAPLQVQLRATAFMFLLRLICDTESLLNLYTLVLRSGAADINAKPSTEEAHQYIELWRQHKAARAFGRSRALADLESCLAAGYILRLRDSSEAIVPENAAVGPGSGEEPWNLPSPSPSTSSVPAERWEGSVAEDASLWSGSQVEVSPQLPRGIGRIFSDGKVGCGRCSGSAHQNHHLNTRGGCFGFIVDSAIRLQIPDFGLRLDLRGLQAPLSSDRLSSSPSKLTTGSPLGMLQLTMPRLEMDYIRDMDSRHIAVESEKLSMKIGPRRVLEWKSLRIAMDDFGDASRKVQLVGEIYVEPLGLWPYLGLMPGWKAAVPYKEAFSTWYGTDFESPELLQSAFAAESTSRTKVYDVEIPSLHIELPPRIDALPTLELDVHTMVFEGSFSGTLRGRFDFMQVLCTHADLPAGLPLLAIRDRAVVSRQSANYRCDVIMPSVDVNVAPFLLHVLYHYAAFDPRVKDKQASSSTAVQKDAPALPNMAVNIEAATLQLWEGPCPPNLADAQADAYQPARMRVEVRGVELGTCKEKLNVSKVHLQIKDLLGTKLTHGDGDAGRIFLSSGLAGEKQSQCTRQGALKAEVTLGTGRRELKVTGASVHLAPTVELLTWAKMMIPFPQSSGSARSSDVQATSSCSKDQEMIWCSVAEAVAAGTGQPRTSVLVVEEALVVFHFTSDPLRSALVHVTDSKLLRRASVSEGCASALAYVRALRAESAPAGVHASPVLAQHVDIYAEKLCMAILHAPAQALQIPCTPAPALAALLHSAQLTAVLPAGRSSSSTASSAGGASGSDAQGSFRSVAVAVQGAAVWSALPSKATSTDSQGGCTLTSLDPELRWPSCPLLSVDDVEQGMQPLLLPHGKGPWLEFAMNGVCVSGCQDSAANGFYSMQPFFRNRAVVYRKPSTSFHLSSDGLNGWFVTKSFPSHSDPSSNATLGSWWVHTQEGATVVSLDQLVDSALPASFWTRSKEGSQTRILPCSSRGVAGGSFTAFVVALAPTLVNGPQPGLHALRQVYDSAYRLVKYCKGGNKEAERTSIVSGSVSAPAPNISVPQQSPGSGMPEPPSLQLFMNAHLDVAFPRGISNSWMRVRCVPRWPKRDVVADFQELSLDIMTCGADQGSTPMAVDCGKSMVQITCSNLYFRMGRAPGKEVAVSIPRIQGRYQTASGWSIFLRPSESDMHIDFHYSEKKQLDIYMWPTSLSIHRSWIWPLGSFLLDAKDWYGSGVLTDLKPHSSHSSNERSSFSRLNQCVWEGAAWVSHLDGQNASRLRRPPDRCLLQVRSDGSLWDVTASRRDRQLWCPEDAGVSDHESIIFPYAAELKQGTSRLAVAVSAEEDIEIIRTSLASALPADVRASASATVLSNLGSNRSAASSVTWDFDDSRLGLASDPSPTDSDRRRDGFLVQLRSNLQKPLQRARTHVSETLAQLASPVIVYATGTGPARVGPRVSTATTLTSNSVRSSTLADYTSIEVAVKGFEIWLPISDDQDEKLEKEGSRELCLLVSMEARGASNSNISVTFPDLAIVHASKPKQYSTVKETLESSFAAITDWANHEDESQPPMSPGGLPPSPMALSKRWVEARLHMLGTAAGDKLMVTNGLAFVILYSPRRTLGVRAQDILIRIPLELLVRWRGLQAQISSLKSFLSREAPEAPVEASTSSSDIAEDGAHTATLSAGSYDVRQLLAPETPTPLDEPPVTCPWRAASWCAGFCCGCQRAGEASMGGTHSGISHMLSKSSTSAYASKSQSALTPVVGSGSQPWALEIEVLSSVDVKFEGGLLAPSQWLIARVSEILFQGSAPPTDGVPSSGTFRFEVLCHNEQLALMEPIVESMEVTVDVQRCKDVLSCSVNTTRVNLNMNRVLVGFCKTIHHSLSSNDNQPLRPIRVFAVANFTDVAVQVHWQGRKNRHAHHGFQRLMLPPKHHHAERLEGIVEQSAELHFDDKAGEEIIIVDLDHSHSRMYLLESSGRYVLVDPKNDIHTGTCVFHIRSPVVIYNETAIPLVLSRESTPMGMALEAMRLSARKSMDASKAAIEVPAGSSVNVPLSWFSFEWQNALIRPALDGDQFTTFPQLSNLLWCGAGLDETGLGGNGGGNNGRGSKSAVGSAADFTAERSQERVNFHTFFSRYLKLMGCADACDVPMGGDYDDLPPAQCFEMRLKDVILFRNTLPVPVILQICAKDRFEQSVVPITCMHSALASGADMEAGIASGREAHGAGFNQVAGRCFEPVPDTGDVLWKSNFEGVVGLTVERKVVSYVLGVDQEVSLPFARRSLHIRVYMLPETGTTTGSCYISRGTRLFLPANIDHIARPSPVTLWRFDDDLACGEAWSSSWGLAFSSEGWGGGKPTKQSRQAQALQVRLEVTRNVVTLFAPLVIENLTPWTFHINSEDPAHVLEPLQLRLLPRNHQAKDTVFIAVKVEPFFNPGQEVAHISDLNRLHRLLPVKVPETCPEKCGLFHDSLSFGVCVRMAQPPLEFTKVVSVLPRFSIYSELSQEVDVCLAEPNPGEKSIGYLCKRCLRPGESFPLHPPSFAHESGEAVFLSNGARHCLPFSLEPPSSGLERQRTFHVEMITEDADEESSQQPPQFYRVAVQQAVLPAKEQSAYICGGYTVMLRDPNFCGSDDVLFHVENKTRHAVSFLIGGTSTETERSAGVIRHGGLVSLESESESWVYRTASEQRRESRYGIVLNFYQSGKCKDPQINITLGSVLTKRPHANVGRLLYQAKATVTRVQESMDDGGVAVVCSMRPDGVGWTASSVLTLSEKFGKGGRALEFPVFVSRVISVEVPEGQDSSVVAQIVGDNWRVVSMDGAPPRTSGGFINQLKDTVQSRGQAELVLQLRLVLNHVEGADGVHHFTVYDKTGALAAGSKSSDMTSFNLNVSVPILSVSWVHRHSEVLAMRVKGIDIRVQREGAGDCSVDASVQHLQVDHFEDGDLPVVLNRRMLHVNSRWLNQKALKLQATWSPTRRIIPEVIVDCVPYWLNLELGVLIRLLERYDSGFSRLGEQTERNEARALLPPELPVAAEDSARVQVWRLMRIIIKPLKFTIHMRSPERSTFTHNLVARWIMRLPADMPNMDVSVKDVELFDQFGTPTQLLKTLKEKYKDKIKYSAVRSIILSYAGTVLKGLLNALAWLGRGPFDALVVAKEASNQQRSMWKWLWWVSPLIHGFSEGLYRAFAEVIGNTVFGLVLFLNSVRHFIFGVTRRRAQGILDGMIYGFQGLLFDSLVMPFSQLYYQTTAAHQDWGWGSGAIVFFLCLLRILLGLGPVMGVFHFLSCCCEGVANVLLHEEAQFAPFENQRRIDPVILDPISDDPIDSMQSREFTPRNRGGGTTMPRKWWLFTRARDVITDDDEVMEKMMQALHP